MVLSGDDTDEGMDQMSDELLDFGAAVAAAVVGTILINQLDQIIADLVLS